eukprot:11389333-Alexandrium_andersonii.AAC.1
MWIQGACSARFGPCTPQRHGLISCAYASDWRVGTTKVVASGLSAQSGTERTPRRKFGGPMSRSFPGPRISKCPMP